MNEYDLQLSQMLDAFISLSNSGVNYAYIDNESFSFMHGSCINRFLKDRIEIGVINPTQIPFIKIKELDFYVYPDKKI